MGCDFQNVGQNSFAVVKDLAVGETEDGTAESAEIEIPVLVVPGLLRVVVHLAVQLDDELEGVTVEVGDEDADGRLPAKLELPQPPVPQDLPQGPLGRS